MKLRKVVRSSAKERGKKLDPRIEHWLLPILEARRARLAREALQAEDADGTPRVYLKPKAET